MSNPFILEILQAINDWQRSTTKNRGKKLETLCVNLPAQYKTVDFACYRKINLQKDGVFSMFAHYRLLNKTGGVVFMCFAAGLIVSALHPYI